MATATIPAGTKWWNGGRSPFNASYGKVMMWYFLMSDAFTFGAFLISYGTIRFSVNYWPDPNTVFDSAPFIHGGAPLVFVSLMTFILIISSVTMVLAVHEGHHMNRKGVEKYMLWTILGGLAFLGCQAWEWTHLLTGEHVVMLENGTLGTIATTVKGNPWGAVVEPEAMMAALKKTPHDQLVAIANTLQHAGGEHHNMAALSDAELISTIKAANVHVSQPGPRAFGGYFFGITGFHGFHVFSGVVINIIMYLKTKWGHFDQRGHYEMIEKTGLYWHFVDLVWVFVFLCFYLI
jgi:cytochrome c oxidase subunit III